LIENKIWAEIFSELYEIKIFVKLQIFEELYEEFDVLKLKIFLIENKI
jgi:hypothetical protein